MLHEALADYLEKIEQAILHCGNAYVERYIEEIVTPEQVNLRIRLRFEQGHLLEISEAVVVEKNSLVPLDYRYHCQDRHNRRTSPTSRVRYESQGAPDQDIRFPYRPFFSRL